jgi:hypothetical protein
MTHCIAFHFAANTTARVKNKHKSMFYVRLQGTIITLRLYLHAQKDEECYQVRILVIIDIIW